MLLSALRGIASNKLRSILTLLGVMIGVASVILPLAVGNGSAQQVNAAISNLGTTTLTVRASGGGFGGGAATAAGSSKTITRTVGDQLAAAKLGHVHSVIPEVNTSLTVSGTSTSQTSITVLGTTPDYFTVGTNKIGSGAAFTDADVTTAAKVAVIGQTLASELFPTGSALGQQISVDGTPFSVVGILSQQGSVGFNDPNSVVIAAQGELEIMLNQLLGVKDIADEPYTIVNQSSLLATAATSAASFTVLLGAVAAISLLVGGIGVTNVMLVTVTERTREIGIRKALGATRGAILGQFLAEAATLTLLGGVLGVIAAIVGAQFPLNGTQPVILAFSIPLALGVSVAIGIFFGVYPAARAAAMRPIQALRAI